MLEDLSNFISANKLGDVINLAGLVLGVVGFGITFFQLWRTKKAAIAARRAAEATKTRLRSLDAALEVSSSIDKLEEIKRHHRGNNWAILPDQYSSLRRKLSRTRKLCEGLADEQQAVFQGSITQLKAMEGKVETALTKKDVPKAAPLNKIISNELDKLNELLIELKMKMEGDNHE